MSIDGVNFRDPEVHDLDWALIQYQNVVGGHVTVNRVQRLAFEITKLVKMMEAGQDLREDMELES